MAIGGSRKRAGLVPGALLTFLLTTGCGEPFTVGSEGGGAAGHGGGQAGSGASTSSAGGTSGGGSVPCGNYVLEFDGDTDRVTVTHNAALLPARLTVEMWIKPQANDGTREMRLLSHGDWGQHEGYALTTVRENEYPQQGGFVRMVVFSNTEESPFGIAPPIEQWSHVAVTHDGTDAVIFQDGEVKSTARTGPIVPYDGPLVIGANSGGGLHHFQGRIDEVRISSVVRYTSNFTPEPRFDPDNDTIALWHFDDKSGSTAKDERDSHDGTLVGDSDGPQFVLDRCVIE